MGIYDRDYYKERNKKTDWKRFVFKATWWMIVFLFIAAFAVYVLAIFSEK